MEVNEILYYYIAPKKVGYVLKVGSGVE